MRMRGGALWRYYWGAHQRFFKDLCVASKAGARAGKFPRRASADDSSASAEEPRNHRTHAPAPQADVSQSTNLLARVFTALAQAGISVEMLSQGASKVNISLVVLDQDADKTLGIIHALFFDGGAKSAEQAAVAASR